MTGATLEIGGPEAVKGPDRTDDHMPGTTDRPRWRGRATGTHRWPALALPGLTLPAVLILTAGGAGLFATPPEPAPPPGETRVYRDLRSDPLENRAPEDDGYSGEDSTTFRIGWFGPSDPADPAGGDFWSGALMALDEVNVEGGVGGRPVRLVPGWSESPWAGGVSRVTRMAYQDRVWAILGSIDGAATHLAEQVVAKALLPLVSPGSTDKTVSFAGVPWMFTLLPGDDAQADAAAAWLANRPEARPLALISTTDHDSRAAAVEWRAAFARAGFSFPFEFTGSAGGSDAEGIAHQVLGAGAGRAAEPEGEPLTGSAPRGVILLASPATSGRLAAALRAAGFGGMIVGGSTLGRRAFLETAGSAAEGAVFPLLHDPSSDRWRQFSAAYNARFSHRPDFAAGVGYDALRLIVEAARRAGESRARIREALSDLTGGAGVLGDVRFDGLGRNQAPVRLGTIRDGRTLPH
jgi:ABC-type branched-subunit amino acid transport system substrate-binding protein